MLSPYPYHEHLATFSAYRNLAAAIVIQALEDAHCGKKYGYCPKRDRKGAVEFLADKKAAEFCDDWGIDLRRLTNAFLERVANG